MNTSMRLFNNGGNPVLLVKKPGPNSAAGLGDIVELRKMLLDGTSELIGRKEYWQDQISKYTYIDGESKQISGIAKNALSKGGGVTLIDPHEDKYIFKGRFGANGELKQVSAISTDFIGKAAELSNAAKRVLRHVAKQLVNIK